MNIYIYDFFSIPFTFLFLFNVWRLLNWHTFRLKVPKEELNVQKILWLPKTIRLDERDKEEKEQTKQKANNIKKITHRSNDKKESFHFACIFLSNFDFNNKKISIRRISKYSEECSLTRIKIQFE